MARHKYISDKKDNKIKWNLLKKIKWNGSKRKLNGRKKTYWNIILKNKRKGSQRELKRDVCEINCREVVFWSGIQEILAKTHSIQFFALKKSTFFFTNKKQCNFLVST